MGAKRTEYQIVGRYMYGKEVIGYHLHSMETGKNGKYTREQVCYLVGRDQVSNCAGQIYQDKVLLRGVGINLDDLPIQKEDGTISNTDGIGKIKKGVSGSEAMTQLLITGTIKKGRNTIGYEVHNAGGAVKTLRKDDVIKLVAEGRIGNARIQNYNGQVLLRGVNCNIDELPCVKNIDESCNI